MGDDIVHILRHGWIHYDNPSFAIIPISTLEQAASTIEKLRKEIHEGHGWTPCSERLPEKDAEYYVTFEDGKTGLLMFSKERHAEGWTFCGKVKVIAWMPLPDPYTEEDNEKAA